MNSLDTNVVLRYLLNDLPVQTKKAKIIITSEPCYVTDVVITETVFVLERVIDMERTDIARLVQMFLGLNNVIYNYYFIDQVIELYAAKKVLSFVDCYAAVEASSYGNSLVTFDKDLIKYGGNHVRGA